MLRAFPEADQGDIGMFARCHGTDLADLDLRGDYFVSESGDNGDHVGQPVLALVRDEHPKTPRVRRGLEGLAHVGPLD